MDDIKDITTKGSFSRILNSTSIRTNAFGNNVAGERAYLRAERIAAAIHLLTNHVLEDEPLRHSARDTSITLLDDVLKLRDEMRGADAPYLRRVEASVRKLISIVRILAVSGRISMQNADVVISALDDLGVYLSTSQRTALSESISLSEDDLALGTARSVVLDRRSRRAARRIKDSTVEGARTPSVAVPTRGRTDEIVGILSTHGQLGIKDIAANLPEYSEKMVQRELRKLVDLGQVKKVGSKRWSMYSLAQK